MKPTMRDNALFIVSIALIATISSCGQRSEEKTDAPVVQELRILEQAPDGADRNPFAPPVPTVHDILTHIWDATDDENVKGLFVRVGALQGAWGSVGDFIEAFEGFRDKSSPDRSEPRPVHCHFETADNVGYLLLASICDRISMSPAGTLDLIGPAAVMVYARSFLEKVGIDAEIIHMGRYKGAGDTLIRDDMPPEAKESIDAILDGLYGSLVAATSTRIEGDEARAQAVIDSGPFTSDAAMEAGLIDEVGFLRGARDTIKNAAGVESVRRTRMLPKREELTLGQFLDLLSGDTDQPEVTDERVAVVFVDGAIVDGESLSAGRAVSGPFVRTMERLEKDDDVKAVVLRINSPGGSALASDRMWEAARHVGKVKPLIASVGDMAASGGYYIASAADDILAHPNSLVGSIGVVGGKLNFEPLADELGISTYVLQRGARAAWSTPVRGLNESEKQAFRELLQSTYDRFIARVASGREMERDAVLEAAEGRVMTAQDGKALGLVDDFGGFGEALARARAAGGLGADSPVELWPAPKRMIDVINDLLSGDGTRSRTFEPPWLRESALEAALPLERWLDVLRVLATERHALVPPYLFAFR